MRRWDQKQLSVRSGVPQPKISQIESGRLNPSNDQLSRIAKALGYSPQFLADELGLLPTTRPWLRAFADAGRREADARLAATEVAVEYVRRLSLKPLPDLLPTFRGSLNDDGAIEDAAQEVRTLAQIDGEDDVVGHALRAAERLGCVLLPLESELGRHDGMSVRSDDLPVVHVAKSGPGDRQRWTVAHEIGHLVLHADRPPPRDTKEARQMERQAHRFAGAFLCPAPVLSDTFRTKAVTLQALIEVKSVWGVSIKALVHRCRDLDIIDDDHARSLYKQISARKWTKNEPQRIPNEAAQWLGKSLMRKAGVDDLSSASTQLARAVGGNPSDLVQFADWSQRPDAQIIPLAERQARRS